MATLPSSQSQNRQGGVGSNRNGGNAMDVGNDAIVRMVREDTRWFAAAVIVLSLILFLALPLSVLIAVDTLKLKAEVRAEMKQLKQLKAELKEK
jgi:hypothetical protein